MCRSKRSLPWPPDLGLDLRARRLHQPSILHARRTRSLATAARQTKIDVLDIRRADRDRRRSPPAPSDKSARAANPFPRAARDTWGTRSGTARNARTCRDRLCCGLSNASSLQMRPYSLPRFRRHPGSNISLIFFIIAKSLPGLGHSSVRFANVLRRELDHTGPPRPQVFRLRIISLANARSRPRQRRRRQALHHLANFRQRARSPHHHALRMRRQEPRRELPNLRPTARLLPRPPPLAPTSSSRE